MKQIKTIPTYLWRKNSKKNIYRIVWDIIIYTIYHIKTLIGADEYNCKEFIV